MLLSSTILRTDIPCMPTWGGILLMLCRLEGRAALKVMFVSSLAFKQSADGILINPAASVRYDRLTTE